MKPQSLDSLLEQFYGIVDQEISHLLRQGSTDLDTVCKAVEDSASGLIAKIRAPLGDRQIRILIQRRLKRTHVELPDALKRAAAEAAQPEFDFHDIEEFRGVPDSITYEDQPGHVIYMHYLDTSKRTRQAARNYLADSIQADKKQLHALDAANEHADQLTEEFGGDEDAVLRDILERWFQRAHGGGSEAGGAGH